MACSRASSASSPSEAEWEQAAAPNDATRPNASTARNDMGAEPNPSRRPTG